ncbi:MAG: NAD-dependent deacylase [Hyphomicrobiaceae bacterium]
MAFDGRFAGARIVVLTGAGLSAESGLATFRDAGGVWARYDYRKVATPEGFAANPHLVHEFYNLRRRDVQNVQPNAAHHALARLEREHARGNIERGGNGGEVLIVTQNVDHLHEAAGARNLIHMHGELLRAMCATCDARQPWRDDLSPRTPCPACGATGGMRPDVVWFGEMPYQMDRIAAALEAADLFISIGTSGTVYPAAGFVEIARDAGAHTVELNLEPSDGASRFDECIHGPATEIVPRYVARLLGG